MYSDATRRRVVNGVITAERSPRTTEAVVDNGILSSVGTALLDACCRYSTELMVFVVAPASLFAGGTHFEDTESGIVPVPFYFVALFGVGPVRRFTFRKLANARLRRKWEKACRFSGLLNHNDHFPMIRKIESTDIGKRLLVSIPGGSAVKDLEDAADRLAGVLEAREVQVLPDRSNARYARVAIVTTDAFADHSPIPWPVRDASAFSMWNPLPLGIDEHGQLVSIALPYENLKAGGIPGTGKSIALSLVAAGAALDPQCRLTVIDGKDVELASWKPVAEHWAGSDVTQAASVITELRNELRSRYQFLEDNAKRKVERGDGLPLHVVIIDELATFLIASNKSMKETRDTFVDGLTELVQKGRAAGIIVVYAMQKQGSDNLPTGLRDLFSLSWAFRCATPEASDTILGRGNATAGYDASDLGENPPKGVGYLLHESGAPTKCRSFYLSDADLTAIAKRGTELRRHALDSGDLSQTELGLSEEVKALRPAS